MRTSKASYVAVAVVALIAVVVPLFLSDLTFFVQMVLAAVVVTGLSLLMGYSGQVSLGQGAFVAVGALTVALMTTKGGLPPLLALACAPVAAGIFAYVVGAPLLRLRGHYLAFGTLALLLIVQALMGNLEVFGAGTGNRGDPAARRRRLRRLRPIGLRLHRTGRACAGAARVEESGAQQIRPGHPGPVRQ